jgi:hypothetical protein
LPDIDKINNVAIADISKLDAVTFADGQKVNNQDVSLVTDAHTLISTHTASSSSSLDITSGIDSTYDVYEFIFTSMHPQTNQVDFTVQFNASGGSGFNETITSTFFYSQHLESGASGLSYYTSMDQAEGTGYQPLNYETGSDADQSVSGMLTLYDPSSTTYVKHFMSRTQNAQGDDVSVDVHAAGYINTTSAIDEISFKFDSGNIDAGVIKMYGLAKS